MDYRRIQSSLIAGEMALTHQPQKNSNQVPNVINAVNLSCRHLAQKTSGSAPTSAGCNGGTGIRRRCSGERSITLPAPFAEKSSSATAIQSGPIAPAPASGSQGKLPMDKPSAVIHYHTSIAVFRRWKNEGMINDDDLYCLAVMLTEKYGLPLDSIYLDQDLMSPEY